MASGRSISTALGSCGRAWSELSTVAGPSRLRAVARVSTSPKGIRLQQLSQGSGRKMSTNASPSLDAGSERAAISSSASVARLARNTPAIALAADSAVTSTSEAIALLRSQPNHYAVASITGRTYLMAPSDLITVPRLNDVQVGDILVLNRVHEVGSRDFTLRASQDATLETRAPLRTAKENRVWKEAFLKAEEEEAKRIFSSATEALPVAPTMLPVKPLPGAREPIPPQLSWELQNALPEDLRESQSWTTRLLPGGLAHRGKVFSADEVVKVTCTVVEHTKSSLEKIVKKKRRKDYKKTIQYKGKWTRLRVDSIELL